jgi:hypothetical protein
VCMRERERERERECVLYHVGTWCVSVSFVVTDRVRAHTHTDEDMHTKPYSNPSLNPKP